MLKEFFLKTGNIILQISLLQMPIYLMCTGVFFLIGENQIISTGLNIHALPFACTGALIRYIPSLITIMFFFQTVSGRDLI